jgi:L-aspartate oxidase
LYVESRVICETYGVNRELVELRNIVTVGELILSSALQRKESRGGHFRADYPRSVPVAGPTIIMTSAIRRLNLGPTIKTTQV